MTTIRQELTAAAGLTPTRGESEQDFRQRLVLAVQDVPDPVWKSLTPEAQQWFNDGAAAMNAEPNPLPVPDFADEEPAAPAPALRARARTSTPPPAPAAAAATYTPKLKDIVTCVTKRGTSYTGMLVEMDADTLVLDINGADQEVLRAGTTVTLAGGGQAEAEPEVPEPEVGDTIEVTSKRGTITVGNLKVIDEEGLVLTDASGADIEFAKDRVANIVVKVKNAGTTTRQAAPSAGAANSAVSTARARTSAPAAAPAAAPAGKKVTLADNGGVSASEQLRAIMADNLAATKEQIIAMAQKAGVVFKEASAKLIYADFHKTVAMLRERKLLK